MQISLSREFKENKARHFPQAITSSLRGRKLADEVRTNDPVEARNGLIVYYFTSTNLPAEDSSSLIISSSPSNLS